MNDVAKNIRKLRSAAGLSQEALAEKLSVTRQTVSSWETGRTQPDIDTLSALGGALGTDITELIYGRKPAVPEGYAPYQKKYIIAAACLAAFIAAMVLVKIFWAPAWMAFMSQNYIIKPELLVFKFVGEPLLFGTIGALLPCFASLWADLRIKKHWLRIVLLCVSVLIFPLYSGITLGYYTGSIFNHFFPIHFLGRLTFLSPGWFLTPGLALFLGLNK